MTFAQQQFKMILNRLSHDQVRDLQDQILKCPKGSKFDVDINGNKVVLFLGEDVIWRGTMK